MNPLAGIRLADNVSIPEADFGSGYQIFFESTVDVDVSVRSLTRPSAAKTIIFQF